MDKNGLFNLEWYKPEINTPTDLPLAESSVRAGFPSPVDDHLEERLDLTRLVVTHPDATFYARVEGDSMKDECVEDGDLLVVDKSLDPQDGNLVVSYIDGEFTLKRIRLTDDKILLVPANKKYPTIEIDPQSDFRVWGIVRYVVKKM